MRRLGLAILTLAAGATAAESQERPPTSPTRDVQVSYRATAPVQGAQRQQDIRVAITAGGQLIRVDGIGTPGGGNDYIIVDRRTRRMTRVMPQDRRYMELPAGDSFSRGFLLNDSMTFTRRGTETIAGLKCTVWDIGARDGGGSACMTDDGVMLRGRGTDGKGGIEATSVKYGTQAASLFKPPAGYSKLDVPPSSPPAVPPGARPPAR
jgi:hypothetical protein